MEPSRAQPLLHYIGPQDRLSPLAESGWANPLEVLPDWEQLGTARIRQWTVEARSQFRPIRAFRFDSIFSWGLLLGTTEFGR